MSSRLLDRNAHRANPLPRRPWAMAMRWLDLLFMHWPVPESALRPHIPGGLDIDTHDGSAWLGVVPFTMTGVRARLTPSVPGLHAFHELNVRTYVRPVGGRGPAGVWFFSLDAANPLAVRTARATFGLPYMDARMSLERDGETVRYASTRTHRGAPPAVFRADYRPASETLPPSAPGTLEYFLTERYSLYAQRGRRLMRGDVHHEPWPLRHASCTVHEDTMTEQIVGLARPDTPPLLHFVPQLDVLGWWPVRA